MTNPTLNDVRRAIERSGYVLELRLVPKLERAGFVVWSDRQFQDQDTGKSREIDLYAYRRADVATQEVLIGKTTYVLADTFQTYLVLECKAISTPLVFFSQENRLPIYGRLLFGGFPRFIWKRDAHVGEIVGSLFESMVDFGAFHSYWSPTHLAARFGRMVSKKIGGSTLEWELDHSGIYPAIEKLCKAAMYVHKRAIAEARNHDPEHTDQFHLHMTYPVLVVSGQIFECRVTTRGYTVKPAKQLFLDWSLTSEKVSGAFRICIVTERAFGSFLRKVQIDHSGVEAGLRRQLRRVRKAAVLEKQNPDLLKHAPDAT